MLARPTSWPGRRNVDRSSSKSVVLGAGPAGLGAAWTFVEGGDQNVMILELQNRVGGLAGTFERDGYLLDYGPHKFYTRFGYILEKMKDLMGDDLLTVPKVSGVWVLGRRFEYPLNLKDLLLGLHPLVAFRCVVSYLAAAMRNAVRSRLDTSYEDYIINRFGQEVYRLVFQPLATKVWGNPRMLDANLARVRVVVPSLAELLVRMLLGDRGKAEISAKMFYYPRRGYMEFWRRIVQQIEKGNGTVCLEARPVRIGLEDGRVTSVTFIQGGEKVEIPVCRMVSTIPLEALLKMIDPPPPVEVLEAAAGLRYRAAILLFIVVHKPRILKDAWIFFPEGRYIFNRISEQKGFSSEMIPPDRTVLTVDISSDPGAPPWTMTDREIFERTMDGLETTRLLGRSEVKEFFIVRIPRVYPIYDLALRLRLETIWRYLDRIPNLISVGRHGYFQHNNSDNALDMGIRAANHLLSGSLPCAWEEQRGQFDTYQIVD